MKDIIRTALIVAIAFVVGWLAGNWMSWLHPFPAPPMGPLEDIRPHAGSWGDLNDNNGFPKFPFQNHRAEEIQKQMDKIRPEIEAFKTKLDQIETDFKAKLDAILTPEQRKLLAQNNNSSLEDSHMFRRSPDGTADAHRGPGYHNPWGERIGFSNGPLERLAVIIIIAPAQQYLTQSLKLSDQQQATLKQLLLERRQRFLELVDTTPPPSLKLGRIMMPPPNNPR